MPTRTFLADGGAAGALMRAHDWSASPLGEPAAWPQPLKTLVEVMLTANQPMFVAWGPGRTLLYNDGYAAILADRHPGAMGRDVLEVWGEIRADLVPIVEEAYAGRPVHMDDIALVMHRRGRTEEAHFSFSYTPVHDEAGRVAGFFCPCLETTEAVLAERRRVAERERLGRMFDQAPGFMALLSGPEHVFDLANEAYRRLVGGRDVVGRPVREALPEVAGQGFFELLDTVYASGERFVADGVPIRLRRASGAAEEERVLDFIYEPVRDGDGAVTGIFVEGQDVTERARAEAELRASEERARRIVEGVKDYAVFVTDAAGTVTDWTPGAEAIFGWPAEEIMGRGCDLLFTPEDRAAGVPARELATAREAGFASDVRWHVRRDGSRFFADGSVRPLHGEGSHIAGFIKIARDETERRAADAALRESDARLRELAGTLESRVAERTVELEAAQEALRQSQKLEAMGSLTGGVAHDFNNLLTPIIGSLDRLVTRGVGSAREQRLMAGALESAERAKTLVQRLLAFARRQPLQAVAVDVGALVGGMAGLIGSTLGPTVEMRVELAPDLPPAKADPNQLEMALLNLAVNARDAMPEGGRLTIGAARESVRRTQRVGQQSGLRQGHYVRLSVADTGTGMDAVTRERAVEPFFSTKGVGRGTGLGLSMVHGLVAQLGGGLTIDSEPGQGTTVALWLPVSAEPIGTADGEGAAPLPPAAARGRALLVDDEDLVRMSTADMLADLGFEVLEAGSGEEALRLLHEGAAVDLLVTDHLMPGMSGADLVREARSIHPGLPALIVSGYAEVEGLAPELPRLVKPFRIADLAERVATLMPGHPTDG